MPLIQNVWRAGIQDPDQIKIAEPIQQAFAVCGIGNTSVNIEKARIERPLQTLNQPRFGCTLTRTGGSTANSFADFLITSGVAVSELTTARVTLPTF